MRRLLAAMFWIAALGFLWLPGCGSIVMACRPWTFSERHFGFLVYYRVRISRDGNYTEELDPESLCLTVVLSVVALAVCLGEFRRVRKRSLG